MEFGHEGLGVDALSCHRYYPVGCTSRTWQPALETLMEGPRRLLEWNETWEFRGVRKGGGWHFRARDFGIYNMLRP